MIYQMVFQAGYENGQTERIVSVSDDEAIQEAISYETKNGRLFYFIEMNEEHNMPVRTVFANT